MKKKNMLIALSAILLVLSMIPLFAKKAEPVTVAPDVDFSKLTFICCDEKMVIQVYDTRTQKNTAKKSSRKEYFYIDSVNNMIYSESKEPVDRLIEFSDKNIKFIDTYKDASKRNNTVSYSLERYTGRIFLEGKALIGNTLTNAFIGSHVSFTADGTCKPVDNIEQKF